MKTNYRPTTPAEQFAEEAERIFAEAIAALTGPFDIDDDDVEEVTHTTWE